MEQVRRGFKTWCENAARDYRQELRLDPVDPIEPRVLAKHLNILVWTPSDIPNLDSHHVHRLTVTERDAWSAVTLREGKRSLIIVNSGHPFSRQNNSLAHEISHVELGHKPAKMLTAFDGSMLMTDYDPVHEAEANLLAGAILLPREALLQKFQQGIATADIATHFGVSTELVIMRRNTTGIGKQMANRQRGTWVP